MGKKGNGHVGDLSVTVLKSIEEKIEAGFAGVNQRLDHLSDFAGERYRDHERRLLAIEQKVGIKVQ